MTKEEFLLKASERYDELQALNKIDNFYDYEKDFAAIWKEFGRSVLESNIGTTPKDRRKKNLTSFGEISIANENPFSKGNNGFQIFSLFNLVK